MPVLSSADIKFKFDNLRHDISLEETEDSWEKIAKALGALVKVGENGGYESAPSEVVNALKSYHRPINSAMHSERTRLCGAALDLLNSVVGGLGREFDHVMPLFMPTLMVLCARTNKVIINRARSAILTIIETAQLVSVLSYFVQSVKDKSASLRLVVAEGTLACLNSCNPPDLEKEARARDIEAIIRGTVRDANPEVRKVSRKIFDSYKILLPSRVESFTAPLSPTMKKYLDIKPATLKSSKSTSNIRDKLKPEAKPSTSNSVSTSAVGAEPPKTHARTASTSTINGGATSQARNLAATLTRVSRKEPAPPARPTQPSRAISEAQKPCVPKSSSSTTAPGPTRTASNPEVKRAAPPLRSQASIISRTAASSAAPPMTARRLHLPSESKHVPAASQPTSSSGPRRVPMPPPAPKKNVDGLMRPSSRVDNTASNASAGRPVVPPPAPTKRTATVTSTARERPATTKPPVPKFKPTSKPSTSTDAGGSSSATSVKPLIITKEKPSWGRPAAGVKPASNTIHKAPAKAVVKKPSSLIARPTASNAGTSKRPMPPAQVVLPPSQIASELKASGRIDDAKQASTTEIPAVEAIPPSPSTPELEVSAVDEDTEQTIQNDSRTQTSISPADTRLPTPTNEETEVLAVEDESQKQMLGTPEFRLPSSNQDLPHTPQGNLLPNPASTTALAAKTPISALLSSIERGFLYSPTTPLSPADSYLPGPNGAITYSHETHAPRVEGPMQAFNYALHANPKGAIFGGITAGVNSQEESKLVCGDIGVVNLSDHNKLYEYAAQTGLPFQDDGTARHAFVPINK